MALHISRDIFERASSVNEAGLYFLAIFLRYVLGFSVVGQTNFNLNGSTITKGSGTGASINMGSSDQFAVAIPVGQYVVSVSDVDRILVLRSDVNPRQNSGLFRITSVNTSNNWVYVNYATPESPPSEVSTLSWAICEIETAFTFSTGANAGSGYRSNGAATASRIILQSPHSSGWQVRLCRESTTDVSNGLEAASVAPGFGGNSAGDFAVAGEHLHHYLWRNQSSSVWKNTLIGPDRNDNSSANGAGRIYLWGDDSTGSVVFVNRNAGSLTNTWFVFGLPEAEDEPLPSRDVQRLFIVGMSRAFDGGAGVQGFSIHYTSDVGDGVWMGGSAYGISKQPVSCCFSLYAYLTGQTSGGGHPRFDLGFGDSSFTFQTELMSPDLIAGTFDNYDSFVGNSVIQLEVRRLGSLPIAKAARPVALWSVSNDKNWFHLMNGVWLPWSGLTPLP